LSLLLKEVFMIYKDNHGINDSKYIDTEKLYKAISELKSDYNNDIIDYALKYLTILILEKNY
ncbi:MAG: hypothetical protein KAI79_07335, partial [Bacteroidales bacterium]|nr:hypothetical protein [Bacteroidales bacterium]